MPQLLRSTLTALPPLWALGALWLDRAVIRSNQPPPRDPTLGHDVMRQFGQSQPDPAAEWVWAAAEGGGRRGAEESVGIVGIEVPIILHTHMHTHARTHAVSHAT